MRKYIREEYSNKYFRKNIDYLTKKHDITKSRLDKIFNIGPGSMSRYCREDGEGPKPSIEIVASIAKYFNVLIDDLINRDVEEDLIEEVKIENIQRNSDLLCKKIIEETRENTRMWYELYYDHECEDLRAPGYEKDYENAPMINACYLFEEGNNFRSKFVDDVYDIGDISIYTTSTDDNTMQVIIMKFPNDVDDYKSSRYELYLVNSEYEIIKYRSSHEKEDYCDDIIYNDYLYKLLRNMYTYACSSRIEMIAARYI